MQSERKRESPNIPCQRLAKVEALQDFELTLLLLRWELEKADLFWVQADTPSIFGSPVKFV